MTQQKVADEKEPGSHPLADLEKSPTGESQEASGTPPGHGDTGNRNAGGSFYHGVTGAGKHHFGILLLAYWHQGLTLPPNGSAAAMYLPGHAASYVGPSRPADEHQVHSQHPENTSAPAGL